MRRRAFIQVLGGVAASSSFFWPLVVKAKDPAMPVIGLLGTTSLEADARLIPFRQGLKETGFVEGQNVAIEYRWAEARNHRFPALAADLP